MKVLVTGGLGYIGSHACVALAQAGHEPVIVDNLCNAREAVLPRLQALAGSALAFHRADVRDRAAMDRVLGGARVDAVMHFAGLKAVGESVEKPALYHDNNVGGSVVLLEAMARHGVQAMVFSSSATVYGDPERVPIGERAPLRPSNPYGQTKLEVERLLAAHAAAHAGFRYAALRYFNPVGAHPSGHIGEDPRGMPNNLLPFVAQVAVGKRPKLIVHGNDYPTPDGTGVRDYIHVMDLAAGHLAALTYLQEKASLIANLGTGRGHSVLELVRAFERASGRPVPLEIGPRRPGDVAACYADPSLAAAELGWKTKASLEEACADTWRWQSQNPDGYDHI